MERCTPQERALMRHAIEHGEVARLGEIVDIVRRTGAISATRDSARAESDAAGRQLTHLPASPFKEALLEFCVRSVDRSS
jgi:octaprenyl-diphosphate synthase